MKQTHAADEWFPVPGYEGRYERNRLGQHRSLRHSKGVRPVPAPVRQYLANGYWFVTLSADNKSRRYSVARAVLEVNAGPCPEGMEACHNNGDSGDNRPENLRWDTHKSNVADQRKHGTLVNGDAHWSRKTPSKRLRGERHGLTRLSEAQAVELISLAESGMSESQLAERFDVSCATAHNIRTGKTWRHLKRSPSLASATPGKCMFCDATFSLTGPRRTARFPCCGNPDCVRARRRAYLITQNHQDMET